VSGNCWKCFQGQRSKVKVICVQMCAITAEAYISTVWCTLRLTLLQKQVSLNSTLAYIMRCTIAYLRTISFVCGQTLRRPRWYPSSWDWAHNRPRSLCSSSHRNTHTQSSRSQNLRVAVIPNASTESSTICALQLYVTYHNTWEWLTANYLIACKVLPTAFHIYFD